MATIPAHEEISMLCTIMSARRRALALSAAALVSFAAASAFAESAAVDGKDLIGDAPCLDIMLEGAMENVYGGAGGELGFLMPGRWAARARGSYSFSFEDARSLDADSLLMGMDGLKAQAGFDFILSDKVSTSQQFNKVLKVAETYDSTTWLGYYYNAPAHTSHALGLDLLLETTGVFYPGFSEDSVGRNWSLGPGYSLYLYPHYRFTYAQNCLIPSSSGALTDKRDAVKISLSIGGLLCPDLSQYGAATEYYLSYSLGRVDFYFGGILGFALRDDVPTGDGIEGVEEPAGLIEGVYVPYRLAFGLNVPVSFAKKEGAR
jgi:hypothetical protein